MALTRSETMARVRSENTTPEIKLRKALWSAGLRYRLHAKDLPGKPDIVFRSARVAVFVHGCFWHSHSGCSRARTPSTRRDYWIPKLERNATRDVKARSSLEASGWKVITAWECEIKDVGTVVAEIKTAVTRVSNEASRSLFVRRPARKPSSRP